MHLLDTWAWMAYFRGSSEGRRVQQLIDGGDTATSVVTLAELSDVFRREKRRDGDRRLAFVASTSRILDLTLPVAMAAGATKWDQRDRGAPMGMADALIYETARAQGLVVLTGDEGFRGLPDVEFLAA